ncbi:MAG: hypothetical protein GY830_03735 [Bacteroidetes bacterium]|nr:hypothetical protein [Bacteroidota bacterium]
MRLLFIISFTLLFNLTCNSKKSNSLKSLRLDSSFIQKETNKLKTIYTEINPNTQINTLQSKKKSKKNNPISNNIKTFSFHKVLPFLNNITKRFKGNKYKKIKTKFNILKSSSLEIQKTSLINLLDFIYKEYISDLNLEKVNLAKLIPLILFVLVSLISIKNQKTKYRSHSSKETKNNQKGGSNNSDNQKEANQNNRNNSPNRKNSSNNERKDKDNGNNRNNNNRNNNSNNGNRHSSKKEERIRYDENTGDEQFIIEQNKDNTFPIVDHNQSFDILNKYQLKYNNGTLKKLLSDKTRSRIAYPRRKANKKIK